MKKAITILSICLLLFANEQFAYAQVDMKSGNEILNAFAEKKDMNVLATMAVRNKVLNSLKKKIAFSKDYKSTIYEVKDLEYKYVYFVGDKIVPLPFDEMKPLLPFRIYVKYKIKEKWGAFEVGGKELLKPEYDEIKYENITHNYFYVRKGKEDYYINPFDDDRKSYLILNEKSEYYPKIAVKNEHYGLVNKAGKLIAPLKYDKIFNFNGATGLAAVKLNKKYGFINQSGEEFVPLKYDFAENFFDGRALVRINHKYGYIDDSGKEIIPVKYDGAESFSEGCASVKLNGRYGFIDETGKQMIALKYDDAGSFSEGLAMVKLNKKYGFIDKSGKEVIPPKYDDCLANFWRGKAAVKLNGKTFYIDKKGNEVEE